MKRISLSIALVVVYIVTVNMHCYGAPFVGSGMVKSPLIHKKIVLRNDSKTKYDAKWLTAVKQKTQKTHTDDTPFVFQHTLNGDWDLVIGQIGFFHDFEDLGTSFVSIIGILTFPEESGVYSTVPWDRKAFWLDVGDGIPMHVAAELYDIEDPEEENGDIHFIYNNYSVSYQKQGIDYSQTEFNGEPINLVLITDLDNNVLDYYIERYDENGVLLETGQFQIGDKIQTWTTIFDLDDPDTIWVTTMEENYRTITSEPQFSYRHLTPNKDFPNSLTQNLIDFSSIDLQLSLFGVNIDKVSGYESYLFSEPKDLGMKWDNVLSSISSWFHFGLGK